MKTRSVTALAAVVLAIVAILSAGCSPIKKELVGEWYYREEITTATYIFNQNGTMESIVTRALEGSGSSSKKSEGACKTKDDKLIMSGIYLDVKSKEYTYALSEDGKTLTLTRDDVDMVLTKVE